ncbi:MAG: phage Gp37/Gp68 family protein [Armatimonadetes bacterium]|nr:phage Gp37/Gp68 family protein [Armatimonadota bacterium]
MASCSGIEWTDATWNPLTGCSKVSAGCQHCYAEALSRRLQAMGNPSYHNGFELTLHHHLLDQPLRWRRPRFVFVNSMSDLFHEDVPFEFIEVVFDTMVRADQHIYQVLTKRAARLAELAPHLPWPAHVWAGVTVERADYRHRVDALRSVPAQLRFLSLEPLLGPLPDLDLTGIDWAIVAGESGPGARPMVLDWARDLRDRCLDADVAFFLKQLGGWPDRRHGEAALLDGRLWKEWPARERCSSGTATMILPGMEEPAGGRIS